MKSGWRRFEFLLGFALALPGTATAQGPSEAYPAKPVRVVVGLAPGGATDIQTRLFAQKLSESLGRSFVVENRTGAGGTVAYAYVAKSPPDGYTLLGVAGGYTITPVVYAKLSYDPVKDFAPISLVAQAPFLLLTHPSLPVKSVKELLALARARPGALDCASAGYGTSTHMAFELFKALSGVKITHVPYKGTGQSLVDVMSGQVHMLFGNVLSSLPHVRAGRLRALGVTTAKRSAVLPESADHRGIGCARLREQHLARLARAGRHAGCRPHPPQRRARQERPRAGRRRAPRAGRRGARRQHERGIRPLYRRRTWRAGASSSKRPAYALIEAPSGVLLVSVRIPIGAHPPLRDHWRGTLRIVGRAGASRAPDTADPDHHRTIVNGHCPHHR